MPLPPNLHLLVPSSTPDVLLEARLYPFPCPHDLAEHLMRMPSDQLPRTEQLSSEVKRELRAFRAMRVVMGSHPWGKLGGTQLDPVLSEHLLHAVKNDSRRKNLPSVVVTYNVRGVGGSHGSSAWVTAGRDPEDYAAVEKWAVDLLGGKGVVQEVKRLGYSWGCISAALAPIPPQPIAPVRSVMLVAPPLAFLPRATWFSSRSFDTAITNLTSTSHNNVGYTDTPLSTEEPLEQDADAADEDSEILPTSPSGSKGTRPSNRARTQGHQKSYSTTSTISFPPSPTLDPVTASLPAPPSGSEPRDQDARPEDLSPPSYRQGGPDGDRARVWTIWGTSDQFTGATRYQNWVKRQQGIRWIEVQGDHFFKWDMQSKELEEWLEEWLDD